jgi:hypothetical protein
MMTKTRSSIAGLFAGLLTTFGVLSAANAADITINRRIRGHVYSYHRFVLPPERHVVEKVLPPYSGNYLINATWFTAMTPACSRWVSGDRIRLVAGEWHGASVSSVFRNMTRGMTCELASR